MKTKSSVVALLLFLTTGIGFAQTQIDEWLLNKFANHKDITQVTITKALLKMAPSLTASVDMNGVNIKDIASKLDQIDIFTSEKEAAKQMMKKEIMAFFKINPSYEVLMTIKDENNHVRFYAQKEGDYIRSLIMFVEDENECVIIRLLGKFTTEDIQGIVENNK
ncbi:MAG: DUF4252 domain-containing protein [Dysgonamonadaceae bacterium]|jgi:galactitol-specific phosphotransferase system IIB component|nr:DUF4252 domain-containing protein [Dysgonamonadaceae bacterium]